SIDAMKLRGMTVSVLFGRQALYERMGWRFCGSTWTIANALETVLPEGFSVRAFRAGDLPYVMGFYDLCAGRLNGAVIRSDAYWMRWVLPQWREPVVLAREERVVGYFTGVKRESDYVTDELCAAPGMEGALADALTQKAFSEGCIKLRFRSALMPEFPGSREVSERAMMVRLNHELCGLNDSDELVEKMEARAGFFEVDGF
ncbi:MAG: hypothetical protein FWG37_04005, partial [Clostridia bacterium]|nr:hypothetical protein [Clostridia bacterium]